MSRAPGNPSIAVVFPPFVSGIMGNIFADDIARLLNPLTRRLYILGVFRPDTIIDGDLRIIEMGGYADRFGLLAKGVRSFLIQLKTCFHLLRISRDIDLVVFHIGSGVFILPLLLARAIGKRPVYSETGRYSDRAKQRYRAEFCGIASWVLPGLFRFLERITYLLASRIIVESESVVNASDLTLYAGKVLVIPMRFIDTKNMKISIEPQDRRYIGYVGRLGGEKGIVNLARALPRVFEQDDSTRCLIGGDGPSLSEVKEELERNGALARTTLAGWIPHEEMSTHLNKLRLFILPSYVEGLPGTVLEAMACGTIVLATPVGGIPDVISDGVTGFLLEDNSPECIAASIARVLQHDDLAGVVRNAREFIEKEHTYKVVVEKYRLLLAEVGLA